MRRYVMHTAEYKADAVKFAMRGDRTIGQVAEDLGVPYTTVWGWCRNISVAKKPKEKAVPSTLAGETVEQRLDRLERENERLRKDNESLRLDREILKKAAADSMGRGNGLMLYGLMEGRASGKNEAWSEYRAEI
jgi:transposase